MERSDTICAISTPPGAGGIGIIRISGPEALSHLQSIFHPRDRGCTFSSHRLYYGHIVHPESRKTLDEVLAVFMAAPATYTREDVVEIHCHGNFLVLQSILELLVLRGARLAEAGEFTKLAYLNGRIDLTRAEAVIDILSARTRKGMDMALDQLGGSLYEQVDEIRASLVRMRAVVEVAIDFPDEDVEIVDHTSLVAQLDQEVAGPLQRLLARADEGRIFREGISVVIVGLPNVGKSSLLNTLLQEERALVTAIPGTTRDTIEEYLDIKGVPVRIVDTAGIRQGADEVEEMGIERARKQIDQADLVLFMLDGARGVEEEDRELFSTVSHKPLLLVANKSDLVGQQAESRSLGMEGGELPLIHISAKHQQNIDILKERIFQAVVGDKDQWQEEGCAPNVRHKAALARAAEAARRLRQGLEVQTTSDLLAIDLQDCLEELNVIVGVTSTEDVLDVIFEQFCLGK
ncbi:MAG: tRNA uridine-5-carboxymethylaminomethyl(34) synthesis GTPase MnmE [Thermodesulfobacteriota bacterium]